jgi:hypothetical protein
MTKTKEPKKRVIRQETWSKNTPAKKDVILKFLNQVDTKVYVLKTGIYEDGKEFISVMIDNI